MKSVYMNKSEVVNYRFSCDTCKYNTNILQNYNTHLSSGRHIDMKKDKTIFNHLCKNCDKHFKSATGLWSHSKTCVIKPEVNEPITIPNRMNVMTKIIDVYNEYEYQLFFVKRVLNETFTDSINFIDFIQSIDIDLSSNYVDSIVMPIINALSKIPLYKRPIYIIKEKNKNIIHVRYDNEWIFEDITNIQSNIKRYYINGTKTFDSNSCIFSGIIKLEEKNNSKLSDNYIYETMYPPNKFIILDRLIEYLGNETPTFMTIINSMNV